MAKTYKHDKLYKKIKINTFDFVKPIRTAAFAALRNENKLF